MDMTPDDPEGYDGYFLKLARDAYTNSTDYFDSNIRRQIEKNIAMFRSKHPSGSKYYTDAYKFRSKLFRPKVRGSIRRAEAAAAVALFSTQDAVTVVAENPSDETQRASAAVFDALMNVRLSRTIPWFLTSVGAFQDAKVSGLCISKQYWEYEERTEQVPAQGMFGEPVMDEAGEPLMQQATQKIKDRPWIDLIPLENFRFAPAADWRNPVESSPYLIHLVPMFITDVKDRMERGLWIEHSDSEIKGTEDVTQTGDSTRAARTGNREDPADVSHETSDFDIVWCHENFIRVGGEDLVYWTLGTGKLLTRPRPLKEAYAHGIRPFVIGMTEIETHRTYAPGDPELAEGLQVEANDMVNQRLDNVRLILNSRKYVRRGSDVDLAMLKRSIPGGIIPMSNLDDVKPEDTRDVTSSSYHEQDRINADFDDLVGSFASGSVATNRAMNETVGGMQMLQGSANSLIDFSIRIFVETWVEPVMRQLLMLEKAYEDDETMLAIAGEQAKLAQRFGVDRITDEILRASLSTEINVGFGSTDPEQRVNKFTMGLGTIAQYAPQIMQQMNAEEVASELFGLLGYKDGKRFFNFEDSEQPQLPPEVQQQMQEMEYVIAELQKMNQELETKASGHEIRAQATIQGKQIDAEAKMMLEQYKGQRAEAIEHIRGQYRMELEGLKAELDSVGKQIDAEKLGIERGKLELQATALQHQIARMEREMAEKIREFDTTTALNVASNPLDKGPIGPDTGALKGVIQRDNYGMIPDARG